MNEYLRLAAAFALGVGAGVLGTKQFFQTKYEKIANEEIESVREALSYRSGHIIEDTSLDDPEKFEEKLEENKLENGGTIKLYSSIDNMYSVAKSEQVKKEIEKVVETLHPEEDRSEDCYEITEEEYSETALGYDKLTLHYYTKDDMLVNADDGDWTNNELGSEAYVRIREATEQNLYFRNDPMTTDYEVVRLDSAYYIDM